MNDPIDEIFNGTPDGIDEDELKQMQQHSSSVNVELQTLEQDLKEEQSSSTTTESQPKQETQPSTEEKPKEENKIRDKDTIEQSFAFGAGALDFGVDTINLIPGVDAPKLPKFHNKTAQTRRDVLYYWTYCWSNNVWSNPPGSRC